MHLSQTSQVAVILSVFLLPIITYLFYVRNFRSRSTENRPLPPATEITGLYIHPVKSCHGIPVKSAKLLPTGLDMDRQWMWVSYPDHEFLTIRSLSKMTLIRPSWNTEKDTLAITAPAPSSIDEKLHLEVPAHPTKEWLNKHTDVVDVKIWDSVTPAFCYSTELTAPFDKFFEREVRLVYKPPVSDSPRELGTNGHPKLLGRVGSTCFPDMMPILVGNEKSIEELNSRLKAAENLNIPITRFRPNIVVRGHEAWEEDRWKTLHISPEPQPGASDKALNEDGFTLDVTQRCARCHVPNVDSETAEEHQREPWNTLIKYRRIDEGINFKPCFGMLCVPRGEGGELRVGMKMEVKDVTDSHRWVMTKDIK